MVNYTPTIQPEAACQLVAESIDPKSDERTVVCTRYCDDLTVGIGAMDAYIKNRNTRGWFIWVTGWMQFTCVKFDSKTCTGEYLIVRLEAVDAART